eukprot:TRINITY_DN1855_c2_g1_i1.p1 TRINITY_DN1855_c2_g1~~TRINITY_DN1855_c2_g1_i1.p1  ORF type:complete len:388 (+),score=123.20 TRINITY_DN1855_c2_g1_i1:82-1245(+)
MGCGSSAAKNGQKYVEDKGAIEAHNKEGTAKAPASSTVSTASSAKSNKPVVSQNGQPRKKDKEVTTKTPVQKVPDGEAVASPTAVVNNPLSSQGAAAKPPTSPKAGLPGAVAESEDEMKSAAQAGAWWSLHTEWIKKSATEILAAYNFFFEHIGIRKGWRTPPFQKEDVQAPFMASAEVVAVVRGRLDEVSRGMVLRQLEGSAMDFLWGWKPGHLPLSSQQALEEFFRGLVFATLSDARGLVEGLDAATVEYYVGSHPIIACGSHLIKDHGATTGADAADAAESKTETAAEEVPAVIAAPDAAPAMIAVPDSSPAAAEPDESAAATETAAAATDVAAVTKAATDAAVTATDVAAVPTTTAVVAVVALADAPAATDAPAAAAADAPAC